MITAASVSAFAIGTTFCLRRPEAYFRAMAFTASVTGLITILVTGWQTGLWRGTQSTFASGGNWLFMALSRTTISIAVTNLLA